MKSHSIACASAAALLALTPAPAAADTKDAIVGGIIGGIVSGAIQNQQRKSSQPKTARKQAVRQAAPSLNSQYSRTERVQIQSSLLNQGYPIGTVDGILGKNSRTAIRMFQGSIGEAQTGQLTPAQFARLTGVAGTRFAQPQLVNRPLGPNEVVMMQQSLQRLGFYRGPIDGIDGPSTQNAAAAFLASRGTNPAGLTNVQALVTVASAAGMVAPAYLVQEANGSTGFGAPQQQPFGQQPHTQQAFGQQPQTQQAFGQQPQAQQAFGAAPAPQAFGQQPQGQQVFGAPQTQQPGTAFGTPQQGQQPLFQQPGQAVPQPQGGQGSPLFASGNPTGQVQPQTQQIGAQGQQQPLFPQQAGGGGQQAMQPALQQQPQSTLDVYAPSTTDASVAVQPQSTFGNTNN